MLEASAIIIFVRTAAQKATWTSDVYSHFRDPEIVQESGEVKYKFTCKK
jgi:hypothetical protein